MSRKDQARSFEVLNKNQIRHQDAEGDDISFLQPRAMFRPLEPVVRSSWRVSAPNFGPKRLSSSALSRGLRVKRSELRHEVGSFAFRTFNLLLLVLRNAHRNGKNLVALFAKVFVEGHRGILSVRRG
jgi:DNA helicase HerA-like ATPase